ncbi:hypothetical protein N0B16_04560 [Chryseobacterium sp. GMJ5]|uniref:HTH luxR-type domain-containing protein n=1 Tax=Chryseobacterium gilvum TaxID=2976534 RepID=A0ABT2VUM2_9FLAO|nr:hypothetical protein [Chryseobacterium gilvum]MCU7613702.1 hypothetical protein [Chryseobacterium gilvum]
MHSKNKELQDFVKKPLQKNNSPSAEKDHETQAENEILKLAKENSPRLLNRYKTLYPEFFEKLSAIQTHLQNSELIFCIYLKLNFTTKEIATFTYVTPKAIQNRKNRIRKKLNIPSRTDIYKWFDEL